MSPAKPRTDAQRIEYLSRALTMNAVHQSEVIVALRSSFHGLQAPAATSRHQARTDLRELREQVARQIEQVRSQFWTLNLEQLKQTLSSLGLVAAYVVAYLLVHGVVFSLLAAFSVPLPGTVVILPILLAGVAAFFLARIINRRAVTPLWHWYCYGKSVRCYRRLWRRELMRFLRQTHLPFHEVKNLIDAVDDPDLTIVAWVRVHFSTDYGLALFSSGLQFLA